jgi:hypothetical protein
MAPGSPGAAAGRPAAQVDRQGCRAIGGAPRHAPPPAQPRPLGGGRRDRNSAAPRLPPSAHLLLLDDLLVGLHAQGTARHGLGRLRERRLPLRARIAGENEVSTQLPARRRAPARGRGGALTRATPLVKVLIVPGCEGLGIEARRCALRPGVATRGGSTCGAAGLLPGRRGALRAKGGPERAARRGLGAAEPGQAVGAAPAQSGIARHAAPRRPHTSRLLETRPHADAGAALAPVLHLSEAPAHRRPARTGGPPGSSRSGEMQGQQPQQQPGAPPAGAAYPVSERCCVAWRARPLRGGWPRRGGRAALHRRQRSRRRGAPAREAPRASGASGPQSARCPRGAP